MGPLHVACLRNQLACLRLLLAAGADVEPHSLTLTLTRSLTPTLTRSLTPTLTLIRSLTLTLTLTLTPTLTLTLALALALHVLLGRGVSDEVHVAREADHIGPAARAGEG